MTLSLAASENFSRVDNGGAACWHSPPQNLEQPRTYALTAYFENCLFCPGEPEPRPATRRHPYLMERRFGPYSLPGTA